MSRQLPELREHQHTLALFGDRLRQLLEQLELAALRRTVLLGAEVLVGMVADLFEMQQQGKHNALALQAAAFLHLLRSFCEQLAVKHRLLRRKGDIIDLLQLVGQIGNNFFISLNTPQQKRRDHIFQLRVALGILLQPAAEIAEFLHAAEQALIEKIKQRPEIGEVVFDRRTRHGDPHTAIELFDLPRLLCPRILDRLRLV